MRKFDVTHALSQGSCENAGELPPGRQGVSTRFQRYLLPGLAFKAVVIGGGYATGRELAEFFLPSGPRGGIAAMALATAIWSAICVATFLFARASGARDYQSFVCALLGPAWVVFEAAYVLFVILILAVYGAAAGAIGAATLGLPTLAGTLALMIAIAVVTAFGNPSVERLFKYVSFLLYGVYVLFVLLALRHFGARIPAAFATRAPMDGWVLGGVTYASYNIVAAIFAALLESGTGAVHAINERINNAWRRRYQAPLTRAARLTIALAVLCGCMLLAQRFGLVALIARGYRALAVVFLLLYVLPLLTVGVVRLRRRGAMEQPTH